MELIGAAQDAGLVGRGGADFPTWRKLAAVASGVRPVVIGNGAEGEPLSAKDRVLLTRAPHLVLDGLQLAVQTVGADQAFLYVRDPTVVQQAVAERRDRVAVTVVQAPDYFVAGEESAVVAAVEGRAALPRNKGRMIVESGFRGRPTLVQNVETLAHLALIARHGPAWFRQRGTFLTTVSGAVRSPGVHEIPFGSTLSDVYELAGGLNAPISASLVGGYHGTWTTRTDQPFNAGIVLALPASACGVRESGRIAAYLARQSAGQCGPCKFGLPALTQAFLDNRMTEAQRLARLVHGRGACKHPDGTARFVLSSMRTFADEVTLHAAGRCVLTGDHSGQTAR